MKKSGNILSFILFGVIAQFTYLALLKGFFGIEITTFLLTVSAFVSVSCFLALRFLMDWEVLDNPIEDYLRETYIRSTLSNRFVIGVIGAFILFFSNLGLVGLGQKILIAGIFSTMFAQEIIELIRIQFNALVELKKNLGKKTKGIQKLKLNQKIINLNKGVNEA